MDLDIHTRYTQLKELEQFISSSKDKVQSILNTLQWKESLVLKDDALTCCAIDPEHRVSNQTIDKHESQCLLRKQNYEPDEAFLSQPSYHRESSIIIGDEKKIEILTNELKAKPNFRTNWNGQDADPKTSDRLLSTFSSDERLALYEYTVKHTKGPPAVPEFNVKPEEDHLGKKSMTPNDRRKMERDAKRRRMKYKSVHTNRKSYTEVMGEVIKGQMELYEQWLLENNVVQRKGGANCWERETPPLDGKVNLNESRCSSDSTGNADERSVRGKSRQKVEYDGDYKFRNGSYRNSRFKRNEYKY